MGSNLCVALSTLKRESQDRFADVVHSIEDCLHTKLFIENRRFAVGHAIAEETGRHGLVLRAIGKKISSDLFDNELVIGHVGVDRSPMKASIGWLGSSPVVAAFCGAMNAQCFA